jgi:TonB family protein
MLRGATLMIGMALFVALPTPASSAQDQSHPGRKIVSRIAPFYPEVAKQMHVGGVVKLEVVVRADGRVKSTAVLGGSPVLIQSATDAIFKWMFERAPAETIEVVQIAFPVALKCKR